MLKRLLDWLRGGPSATERLLSISAAQSDALLTLLRDQSAAREKHDEATFSAVKELLASAQAQSSTFSDYLRLVSESSKPVVRVMTDQDEAVAEALRTLKAKHTPRQLDGLEDLGVVMNDMAQPRDFQHIFDDLKRELP